MAPRLINFSNYLVAAMQLMHGFLEGRKARGGLIEISVQCQKMGLGQGSFFFVRHSRGVSNRLSFPAKKQGPDLGGYLQQCRYFGKDHLMRDDHPM